MPRHSGVCPVRCRSCGTTATVTRTVTLCCGSALWLGDCPTCHQQVTAGLHRYNCVAAA